MPTIVLDPGHYKNYNRGIVAGFYEGNSNLAACVLLKKELEGYGFTVYMTRTGDKDVGLEARGKMAVEKKADMFLSWHSDAAASPSAKGATVYLSCKTGGGKQFAAELVKAIATAMGTSNRGVVQRPHPTLAGQDYYQVLRASTGYTAHRPAISMLVEHGFHTNSADCAFLDSGARRAELVKAEAKAIAAYFGMSGRPAMHKVSGKVLRTVSKDCEWFGELDINRPGGKLPAGLVLDIQTMSEKAHQGYTWVSVQHGGRAKLIAVAPGRCVLEDKPGQSITPPPASGKLYRVQVGAFAGKANAEALVKQLKAKGFEGVIV